MHVRYIPKRDGQAPLFWAKGTSWSPWPSAPTSDRPEPAWLAGSEYSVYPPVAGYDWADQLAGDLRKLDHRNATRLIRERAKPLRLGQRI